MRIQPALVLWGLLVAAISGYPIIHAAAAMFDAYPSVGLNIRWVLLLQTLAWALGIGVIATVLALPIAFATRGLRVSWAPLVAVPLLLPMPLAYAGLNLIRAPGTEIGDFLALGPSWRAIAAGRLIAVLALAFWSTSLASVVLSLGVRGVDRALPEAAALAGAGRVRRLINSLAAMRASLLASILLIAVVMTGSAIPLHLAQINTYAIVLWLELDAAPSDQVGRVWIAALPVLLLALSASTSIAVAIARHARNPELVLAPPRTTHLTTTIAILTLGSASVLPLALLAREITTIDTFAILWRTERGAVIQSVVVASAVGCASAGVALTARIIAREYPRITALGLALLMTTALAPGVLVGSAVAASWKAVPALADTPAIVILAQLARIAAYPAILGTLIAAAESVARRDARTIDGAAGIIGTIRGAGDSVLAVAVGLAAAAMSLGEIEASIVVQTPGAESMARSMLNMLHFARYEHLSGLVLLVAGPTLTLAGCAWILFLLGRTLHRRRAFQ